LQLAAAHPSRLVGTFGHDDLTTWFQDNIDAIFQADGPLGMVNQVSLLILLHHFSLASNQARELYDCQHSKYQSGATHKDVSCVTMGSELFYLFEAQKNVPSASVQAAETRNERHSVVSGLTGHHASLGNHHGCGLHSCIPKHQQILGLGG
jgi:hypothetical protein